MRHMYYWDSFKYGCGGFYGFKALLEEVWVLVLLHPNSMALKSPNITRFVLLRASATRLSMICLNITTLFILIAGRKIASIDILHIAKLTS